MFRDLRLRSFVLACMLLLNKMINILVSIMLIAVDTFQCLITEVGGS